MDNNQQLANRTAPIGFLESNSWDSKTTQLAIILGAAVILYTIYKGGTYSRKTESSETKIEIK